LEEFGKTYFAVFRIRIQGFDDQKFKTIFDGKKIIFIDQNCIYLSLAPIKERPRYRRSVQPSKENIQHFKT
jgi:hypothetical protein